MYKLEMHLHTLGRSPCAETDEKTIAELYHEHGYDGIVCTNHYISYLCENYYPQASHQGKAAYYLDGYYTLQRECARYGIDVFLGLELLLDCLTYYKPDPPKAELLVYGITPEWLLAHPYDLFSMTQPELRALCDREGWILGQSHPYRNGITVQDPNVLEAVEVYNGHPDHDSHNDLALAFAQKHNLLMTAGSDFHKVNAVGSGVYLENPVHTNAELVAELRRRTHRVFRRESGAFAAMSPVRPS